LLALPLLGETPPRTWCSGEHGEFTPGTWEPRVEGVKGARKGAEGLVEGKAADVSTQRVFASTLIVLILVAFVTGNSSLEPLIEGLYAQIHVNLR